jgi:hypothetical protein
MVPDPRTAHVDRPCATEFMPRRLAEDEDPLPSLAITSTSVFSDNRGGEEDWGIRQVGCEQWDDF